MNGLDNYFREKVANHGTSPSPGAWEKVEARISKKNNTTTALKIAAAVAVLSLVSIVLWDQSNDNSVHPVAEQKPPVMKSDPGTQPNTVIPSETPEHVNSSATSPRRAYRQPVAKKNPEQQATQTPDAVVMESVESEEELLIVVEEKPKAKKIVIVYTLPTINKNAPQDVATLEEEKRNGLQKVMDVAMEMRASEIPLGELREAKDDLFALEFKKDKTKTKN